jgi:hypothetical protein
MAAWRKKAIELLPSETGMLETEDRLGASWILEKKLVDALLSADQERVKAIVSFVLWLKQHCARQEWMVDMAHQILGESVQRESTRAELWRALDPPEFGQVLPLICGALRRDVTKEFEREFRFTVR